MSNIGAALLIGLIAGTHIAALEMYRTSPYEGLVWSKYFRSIVLGALVGLALQAVIGLDMSRAAGWVLLFGLVYAVERIVLALWERRTRGEE